MFGGFLNKITTALEQIDGQVASTVSNNNNNVTPMIIHNEDEIIGQMEVDTESLMANNNRLKMTISSLEDQVKRLSQIKDQLESELRNSISKAQQQTDDLATLGLQNNDLKSELKHLERKYSQDSQLFEQTRINLEDVRTKLEKEVAALSERQFSLQQELSLKNNENTKLFNEVTSLRSEVSLLESDIVKYREKAVESLSSGVQNQSVSSQLEMLEAERSRLRDRYNKSQQRIVQLETATKEMEEQMQNEISEYRRQQNGTETELFRVKTQNEALTHELALVRSQLFASREAAESRFKAQLQNERNEHKAELSKLREEFSRKNSKSTEEELLNSYAIIESLKGEKAALLMKLENGKPIVENFQSIGIAPKKRTIPISSIRVSNQLPQWLNSIIMIIDQKTVAMGRYLSQNPILRLLLFIWFILIHIILIF